MGEIKIKIEEDGNEFKYTIDIDRPTEEYSSKTTVGNKFSVINKIVDELDRYKEKMEETK